MAPTAPEHAMADPSCPICRKLAPPSKYRPFCCKRCADVDLSRWLSGTYVIPGAPLEDDDDAPGEPLAPAAPSERGRQH